MKRQSKAELLFHLHDRAFPKGKSLRRRGQLPPRLISLSLSLSQFGAKPLIDLSVSLSPTVCRHKFLSHTGKFFQCRVPLAFKAAGKFYWHNFTVL